MNATDYIDELLAVKGALSRVGLGEPIVYALAFSFGKVKLRSGNRWAEGTAEQLLPLIQGVASFEELWQRLDDGGLLCPSRE